MYKISGFWRKVLAAYKASKEAYQQKEKNILYSLLPYLVLVLCAIGFHAYAIVGSLEGLYYATEKTDSTVQYLQFNNFLLNSFQDGQIFWAWNVGIGGDIFAGFSYYFTCSPFFYLALLLKMTGIGTWDFTGLLIWKLIFSIVKQFLAFTFMYKLLRYENKKIYLALIGALVYGGSLYVFFYGSAFDNYTEVLIWLPLTILGIQKYKQEKKIVTMIIGAALSVASSFYFGFMSYIFYIIYILVFLEPQGEGIKARVTSIIIQLKDYVILFTTALGIGALFFLPSVVMFLGIDRTSPDFPSLEITRDFILSMPRNLFFDGRVFAFPLICLVALFCSIRLMSRMEKRKTIFTSVFFLFCFVPFVYDFFNGFSYPSDRWYFLIIFAVAYGLADWIEDCLHNKRFGIHGFIMVSLFVCLVVHLSAIELLYTFFSLAGLGIIMLAKYINDPFIRKVGKIALVTSVCLFLGATSYAWFKTYIFLPAGDIDSPGLYGASEQQVVNNLRPEGDEFYRVDFYIFYNENNPLTYDYFGVSQYNSLLEGDLSRWWKQGVNIRSDSVGPSRFAGFDDRLFLDTIFAVKYKVFASGIEFKNPFFKKIEEINGYQIFENENLLSIDAWYEYGIKKSYYDTQNIASRDAMLLMGAVTEKKIEGLPYIEEQSNTVEIQAKWEETVYENCEYDGRILTTRENAEILMPLDNISGDGELLVTMSLQSTTGETFLLDINGSQTRKYDYDYPYNYDYNHFTFRLDGNADEISMKLPQGEYLLEGLKVYKNFYKDYVDQVTQLNKYSLENLSVNGNVVKGNISNGDNGLLALSIPYSSGWKAKVDGKPMDIIRINDVLSGLYLTEGTHDIELHYVTPGFYLGLFISAVSLAAFIVLCRFSRVRRFKDSTHTDSDWERKK